MIFVIFFLHSTDEFTHDRLINFTIFYSGRLKIFSIFPTIDRRISKFYRMTEWQFSQLIFPQPIDAFSNILFLPFGKFCVCFFSCDRSAKLRVFIIVDGLILWIFPAADQRLSCFFSPREQLVNLRILPLPQ